MSIAHTPWMVLLLVAASMPALCTTAVSSDLTQARAWGEYLAKADDVEPAFKFPHQPCFDQAARAHQIPVTLLLAVARGESDFQVRARSKANAHGLMQIQWPGTARHLGILRLADLYEPCINVEAGARYLRELLDRYEGNLHLSLAAYNYGPARIQKAAANIPRGAAWYSSYIYRHLQHVLGAHRKRVASGEPVPYGAEGKLAIIEFHKPYRAQALVDYLGQLDDRMRVDWFRLGLGRFRVVLLYGDEVEMTRGRQALRKEGFSL